jgi:hypothetical protein
MLLETNFQNPFLAPFGWLLNAITVPDLDPASAEARRRAEGAERRAGRAGPRGRPGEPARSRGRPDRPWRTRGPPRAPWPSARQPRRSPRGRGPGS